ncbi:serine/threonine-protein kinase HipA [Arsukibacterium tuosuense]|uniref:Serine/threonine-protein kinase HipA n=1 Tax=Arsukibacterium tuosuense TaxID=1323745 RepID=A0A285J9T7_9GAMM|nr:HipA domain-containing protein [Arsukibacterium tuosuense]SNY56657.1 serine/threonine-protein kinase HipA [Arsukibacterium tuosuense]
MSRTLDVFVDTELVGKLTDQNNIWSFQYHPDWLARKQAHPLSPALPLTADKLTDGASIRPVQWFFDNLLPEEAARELLAQAVKLPQSDVFGLLEAAGAESAGAITLLPQGQTPAAGSLEPLNAEELSARIRALPKTPLNRAERKRMSLAGAQHKMLVVYHDKQLFEPSGFFPSTHILKPEHTSPELYFHTPRNEWFVMKLAAACGLNVPEVDIQYLPEPVYLIERFDRTGQYPNQQRLHVLDGCQLLNLAHTMKYSNSTVNRLKQLADQTRKVGITRLAIFKWAVFNALVGNGDAHLKNLSFFISSDKMVLTPHYDLLSTIIYADIGKHLSENLSQPMGNAITFDELTQADVLAFASELNIAPGLANRELQQLLTAVPKQAAELLQQVQSLPPHPGKAGELRMLRQICRLAIADMVQRLQS